MSDAIKSLQNVKRRLGKERAAFERLYQSTSGACRERAFGESNVCTLAMNYIDDEIRKIRAESK